MLNYPHTLVTIKLDHFPLWIPHHKLYFIFFSKNSNSLKFAWDDILRNVYEKKNADENFDFNQSTPTMVLSVIGDTDNHVPTTWPTSVFQKALIEAARNGGGKLLILFPGNKKWYGMVLMTCYMNTKVTVKSLYSDDWWGFFWGVSFWTLNFF